MLSNKDGGSGGAKDNDVNINAFNNIDVDKSGAGVLLWKK